MRFCAMTQGSFCLAKPFPQKSGHRCVGLRKTSMDQDGTKPKKQRSKPYDADFKRSVVEHWVSSRQTAAQVARDFGVNIWNLRDWKRQYGPAPKGEIGRASCRERV